MCDDNKFVSSVLGFMNTYNKINQYIFSSTPLSWIKVGTIQFPDNNIDYPLKIEIFTGKEINNNFINNILIINFLALKSYTHCKMHEKFNGSGCVYEYSSDNNIKILFVQINNKKFEIWLYFKIESECSMFIYNNYNFTFDGTLYNKLPSNDTYLSLELPKKIIHTKEQIDRYYYNKEEINTILHCSTDISFNSNCLDMTNNYDISNNFCKENINKINDNILNLESKYRLLNNNLHSKVNKSDFNQKLNIDIFNNYSSCIDNLLNSINTKLNNKADLEELNTKANNYLLDDKVDRCDLINVTKKLEDKINNKVNKSDIIKYVDLNALKDFLRKADADNIYIKKTELDKKIFDIIINGTFVNPSELYNLVTNTLSANFITKDAMINYIANYTYSKCNLYTQSYINDALDTKVNITDIYSKAYIDYLLNLKVNTEDLDLLLNSNYYSQTNINNILLNYYTKTQITHIISSLSGSGGNTLSGNYYTSNQIDNFISALSGNILNVSNNITRLNNSINTLSSNLSITNPNFLNNIINSLSTNYYSSNNIDNFINTLSGNLLNTNNNITQLNNLINTLSSNLSGNYSTTTKVYNSINTLSSLLSTNSTQINNSINTLSSNLFTNYSTTTQINALIRQSATTLSGSINFSNYYTTTQTDSLINNLNNLKANINSPTFSGNVSLPSTTYFNNKLLNRRSSITIYFNMKDSSGSNYVLDHYAVDSSISDIPIWNLPASIGGATIPNNITILLTSSFTLPYAVFSQGYNYHSGSSSVYDVSLIGLSNITLFTYINNGDGTYSLQVGTASSNLTNFKTYFGIGALPTVTGIFPVATLYLIY